MVMPTPSGEAAVPGYNPGRGAAALAAVRPAADALAPTEVRRITANLLSAGLRAIAVAQQIHRDPALVARFEALAPELDTVHLARLESLGWSVVHVHTLLLKARAQNTEALVPVEVVNHAVALKARMMKVAEYNLGDDPTIAAELASIRSGSGHTDLALDLNRLAAVYDASADELADDTKRYQPGDADDARRTSDVMVDTIANAKAASLPEDLPARLFTLLWTSYSEVRDAALWLQRHDLHVERLYPTLHALQGAGRPKSAPPEDPTPETPPVAEPAEA